MIEHKELGIYLLEKAMKKGADDVVVQIAKNQKAQSKFANNKISALKSWDSSDIGLFLAKDQKTVMTSLKKFSKKDANSLLDNAFNFLKKIDKNESYRGIAKGPFNYSKKEYYDPSVENLNVNELVKEGIDLCKEKKIRKSAGVFENSIGESYLLTSENVEAYERGSSLYFSFRALADKNSSGHTVAVSRNLSKLDFRNAVERACDIAFKAKGSKKRVSGKFDVLFEPLAWANLLETAGESSSIFSVEAGLSFFQDQLGKEVAHESVNFWDDATMNNGLGSCLFDAEGMPTKKNLIIENGKLKTYLHNTSSAKRYNVENTANSGLVSPDAHNLVFEEGKYSKDKIFSEIKRGIWITNVWYTRFQNYATGDFSTIPRDGIFLIENGEIVKPLKEIRITDNVIK
ncbi:TldE-like protein, partial [archaeon]|nr:TldE-like protein [archaeon]